MKLDVILGDSGRARATRDAKEWQRRVEIAFAQLHPAQRALADDTAKRIAALVGRGGGKTTGVRARFLRKLNVPRAQLLYLATTRDQAEELMWQPFKELLAELDLTGHVRIHEAKLRITCVRTRAVLQLAGADNLKAIEKYRGRPYDEVWIDEAASHTPKLLHRLIKQVITPRLGDRGGVLGQTGTPGQIQAGPFWDVTRPGSDQSRAFADRDLPEFAGWNGWSFHNWSLKDGADAGVPAIVNLWRNALEEKARSGWSDDNPLWRREYLGRWALDDTETIYKYRPFTEAGEPFNQWDPARDAMGCAVLPPAPRGAVWRFIYGMDLGWGDSFALEIFAFHQFERKLWHFYEFLRRRMYARAIAQLLLGDDLDPRRPGGLIGVTGWPADIVADSAHLGGMVLAELENVYGIRIDPADRKDKHDAIELWNGDLVDGRTHVLKGSQLEAQMMALQWDVGDHGELKEPRGQPNDACDAAIMARRKAIHHFAEALPAAAAPPGSAEALNEQARREEQAAARPRAAWTDLMEDSTFAEWE